MQPRHHLECRLISHGVEYDVGLMQFRRRSLFMPAVLLILCAACTNRGREVPSDITAFVGAQIMADPSNKPIDDAVLLVRGGKVMRVGPRGRVTIPGAPELDLSGKYILPGMISGHVHISDVNGLSPREYTEANTLRQLGVFARYGITTGLSLGGEKEPAFALREAQDTPSLNRARLFLSGDIITGKTPEEARAQVVAVAAVRPDWIKIRVDDNLGTSPKMTPAVYRAVIDEAHARGLRLAAHVFYLEDAKDLLRAGADMIAHSVRDKEIDDEFISLMKARDIPYCPTLTRELSTFVYETKPAFFDDPFFQKEADKALVTSLLDPASQKRFQESKSAAGYKAALEVAKRNLKKASDAGILIVMGTDAGPMPERFQGYFEHLEMEMMVEAGMSPRQVLVSATSDAASALAKSDLGTLQPGAWADFVVLDRDPLADIRNTRSISTVRVTGNPVIQ